MKDWPLLLVAAALLIGGGTKAAVAGELDGLASALLASGLVVLGAWLTVEVRRNKDARNDEPKD